LFSEPDFRVPRAFAFPRARRLTESGEFRRVFECSQRLDAPGFSLLARPNRRSGARLGMAIAKRNCPRALDRGRLKRIVRESFRTHYDWLPPLDIVVLATAKARNLENRTLFDALARSWRKLGGH
jgi:ribonuclease P protein component